MFSTDKTSLKSILDDAHHGRLQLPEFQREYIWEDEKVHGLIASVAKGLPIGALLTLETGGSVKFKPRLIEGVTENGRDPRELLLDGQQRITSLYQALYSKEAVHTKTSRGKKVERYYYLDINKAMDSPKEFESAILTTPEKKSLKMEGRILDLSKPDTEFEQDLFPLNQICDWGDWYADWRLHWRSKDPDIKDQKMRFMRGFFDRVQGYLIPMIKLDNENKREAICLVFEKLNTGGVLLNTFELLTAIYAGEEFNLREDLKGSDGSDGPGGRLAEIRDKRFALENLSPVEFLQACSLIYTYERRREALDKGQHGNLPPISCKRNALLELPLGAYKNYADTVEKGFRKAGEFLTELKIVSERDIPSLPLAVGLASTFAILGDRVITAAVKKKVRQWFWSITLGELYGSTTDTQLARDVPELVTWISNDKSRPQAIDQALFLWDRLDTLRGRQAAAYKGIYALILEKGGCRDFITGAPADLTNYFQNGVEIHHIFPVAWCRQKSIDKDKYNSIVNKTPLFWRSNRNVGGRAPSAYLDGIEQETGLSSEELDGILRSHLIEPEYLRRNDFDGFYEARKKALGDMIAKAMGKPVVMGQDEEE